MTWGFIQENPFTRFLSGVNDGYQNEAIQSERENLLRVHRAEYKSSVLMERGYFDEDLVKER